jgi:hypothetical protein
LKRLRGPRGPRFYSGSGGEAFLEDREIAQERENADDDDDDLRDLFHFSVERKHIDEIENENDDENGDEKADKRRHTGFPPFGLGASHRCPHGAGARVPARPDGTEIEDCSIQIAYSNEKT